MAPIVDAAPFPVVPSMKSRVGTVFIASAAADYPRWRACPPGSRGCRGRDEYGPYGRSLDLNRIDIHHVRRGNAELLEAYSTDAIPILV
jgi:hypothetical protein